MILGATLAACGAGDGKLVEKGSKEATKAKHSLSTTVAKPDRPEPINLYQPGVRQGEVKHIRGDEDSRYSNNPRYIEQWSSPDFTATAWEYVPKRAKIEDPTTMPYKNAEFVDVDLNNTEALVSLKVDGQIVTVRPIGIEGLRKGEMDAKMVPYDIQTLLKDRHPYHGKPDLKKIIIVKDPGWPDKDEEGNLYRHVYYSDAKSLNPPHFSLAYELALGGHVRFWQPTKFKPHRDAKEIYQAEETSVKQSQIGSNRGKSAIVDNYIPES